MVRRYSVIDDMPESEAGEMVAYEDYKALEEAYAELQERYDLDVNPEAK